MRTSTGLVSLIVLAMGVSACSSSGGAVSTGAQPTTTPSLVVDEAIREQIHAATGHEPEECVEATDSPPLIIEEEALVPDCVIVHGDAALVIANDSSVTQTFAIADPPGPTPQHDQHRLEIPSGDQVELSGLDSRPGPGVWRMYTRGGTPSNGMLLVIG